jgi:hypothetical protein
MGNEFFAASLRKDEDERVKRKGEMQIKKNWREKNAKRDVRQIRVALPDGEFSN